MAYIFEKSVPKHNTSKNGGIPSGILDFISKGKKRTISRLATRQFLRWLLDDKVFFAIEFMRIVGNQNCQGTLEHERFHLSSSE